MTYYEKIIKLRNEAKIKAVNSKGLVKTFWQRAFVGFCARLASMTFEEAEREVEE